MTEVSIDDEDLERYIEAELRKDNFGRTLCLEYQGKILWVKCAEEVRHRKWLQFSRWLCVKLGLAILQPGADQDGMKALRFETARLRRLAARGLPVPRLVASGKNWLALVDAGRNLRNILRDENITWEEKRQLTSRAAEMLALFHAAGIHHGRPAVKDMTYDGEQLCLLDFEDGIMMHVSRHQQLQRDLLLFLQSVVKESGNLSLTREALRAYGSRLPKEAAAACAYFASFNGLYLFFRYFLRYFGRDLENTYRVLELFHKEEFA